VNKPGLKGSFSPLWYHQPGLKGVHASTYVKRFLENKKNPYPCTLLCPCPHPVQIKNNKNHAQIHSSSYNLDSSPHTQIESNHATITHVHLNLIIILFQRKITSSYNSSSYNSISHRRTDPSPEKSHHNITPFMQKIKK
jgi:hypothetical protein